MCTFADLMSLLMCFFILLLSFSVMDNQKFKQVAGSMEKAFGIQREERVMDTPMAQTLISVEFLRVPLSVQLKIQNSVMSEMESGEIEMEQGPEGLTLRVKGEVAFDSGSARIKPKFEKLLDKLGRTLADLNVDIVISGHTDDVPVRKGGEFASNWQLSSARAVAVVEYWIEKFKIPHDRLAAVGNADGQALTPNRTSDGRAKNRRVEFLIKPRGEVAFEGLDILKTDKPEEKE